MREIRFRGKRISDNKWVYGYFLVNQFGEYTICDKTFSAAVIPETVGQYIGLPDKNNKEIYGGDILKFDIMGDMEKYNPLKALLVIVEYQNASWGFRRLYPELVVEEDREWCSFWRSDDEEIWDEEYFEIIGNQFENPELLKNK